eukprot:3572059-Rhodomonas_salina.1
MPGTRAYGRGRSWAALRAGRSARCSNRTDACAHCLRFLQRHLRQTEVFSWGKLQVKMGDEAKKLAEKMNTFADSGLASLD